MVKSSGQAPNPWNLEIGANPEAEGTHFRVWARDAQRVEVVFPGSSHLPYALRRESDVDDEGYFSGYIRDIVPGTHYKYRLDGKGEYPDPASRYQPYGVHGPSQVVDPSVFTWSDAQWQGLPLEQLIIYEVHVGTATPEGTFDSLIPHLRDLGALGVTAIQLMAIGQFPGNQNWGYDGVDIFAPAQAYGGPEALRRLVDAAHGVGLAIILDVVFNHVGPEGNYLAQFSRSYFTDGDNWGSKRFNYVAKSGRPVRDFFVANACYWLHEYHIDGLRLDAIQAIRDSEEPHIVSEIVNRVRQSLPSERHFVIIAEDECNDPQLVRPVGRGGYGLDAVYADDFHHQVHVSLTGERTGYYMDYSGSIYDLVETMQRGWWFIGQQSAWRSLQSAEPVKVGRAAKDIAPPHFIYCIQNHDQIGNRPAGERLSSQVPLAAYRAVSALLLLSPFTPLLFMGQEWAASTPFQFFTDFQDAAVVSGVRDGRPNDIERLFPGRGAETPDPQDPETFRRSKLQWSERRTAPHDGIYRLYRDLIRLRRALPALARRERSSFAVEAIGPDALALRRSSGDHGDVLLVVNLRDRLSFDLTSALITAPKGDSGWSIALDTEAPEYGGRGGTNRDPRGLIELRGPAAVVLMAAPPARVPDAAPPDVAPPVKSPARDPQAERSLQEVSPRRERYFDFDLHVSEHGHVVASSPQGQASATISPTPSASLQQAAELLASANTGGQALKAVGAELYTLLFPGPIHTHLHQTEAAARQTGASMRIRLRIEAPQIARQPLELLYREAGGYFFALNPRTVLSRYLQLPLPPAPISLHDGPLHMLVIIAAPEELPPLVPDEWEQLLLRALEHPIRQQRLRLQIVKLATWRTIRHALRERSPDVVQFIGHGFYSEGKGYLALVDEDTSRVAKIDDESFANLFLGYDERLHLMSLMTCASGQSDDPQRFLGIAPKLVQRGIPAVVAMQHRVGTGLARIFLEEFFSAVADRKPIDWAVQSARNMLAGRLGVEQGEFAAPVLYMRSPDGVIF